MIIWEASKTCFPRQAANQRPGPSPVASGFSTACCCTLCQFGPAWQTDRRPQKRPNLKHPIARAFIILIWFRRMRVSNNGPNRFGVVGFNQPNASLQRQSNLVVQHFRSICSPSNLQVFRGRQAADRTVIVVACGSYSRQPGTGQMAAVMFLKNKTQSVTMRREWRGPAFQSKVASTWPVPKRELDGVLSELYRSRLLALKKH